MDKLKPLHHNNIIRFFATFVFLSLTLCALAQEKNNICHVETREYPGKDPDMWDGLYAAKNGNVYTGLITEGGSSHFYVYNPSNDKNILLYDIAEFLNERGKGIRVSGKLHNKPVEDEEGNIYFVPINNGSGPRNIDFTSWRGGNWLKYNPKTRVLENMGLVDEGIGCYPLAIDSRGKYLYGVGFTGYFYRFDLDKRITKNFGRVANWDIGRTIFSDDKGNIYGCFPIGRIWKYDAEKEEITDLSITLPFDPTIYPTQLLNPMIDRTYDWRAIAWDTIEKVAYGITAGSGSILFRYDTKIGTEGEITPLVKLCDSKFLQSNRKDIPYSTLAFALDSKNRKVFFVPSAREYTSDNYVETLQSGENSHLIMYDLEAGKRIDLGALQTKDGREVFGCEAASVGADGTLYICGLVEVRNLNKATSKIGNLPVALQLIIYNPNK